MIRGPEALTAMRRARQRRHRAEVDWVDSLYNAYLSLLAAVLLAWYLTSAGGDEHVSAAGLRQALADGPALVGLAVAVAVGLGLRSGSRGGPLALDAGDVRFVLLAPVSRRDALRRPVLRQWRSVSFAGLCLGAVAGKLAGQRLPRPEWAWLASGAAAGGMAATVVLAAAYLACGARLSRTRASAGGAAVIGWSAADLWAGSTTSPLTLLGRFALAPLGKAAGPPAPVAGGLAGVLAAVLMGLALGRLGNLSLEAAQRRARLLPQLRFALSLQDIRTVVLLRRKLTAESPRRRPWVPLRGQPRPGRRLAPLWAVWHRGWRSLSRWPAQRLVRVGLLVAIAAWCAVLAWRGTTPLLVGSGLALYVAALDVVETLAQDVDHPTLRDSFPIRPGALAVANLAVPLLALAAVTGAALLAVGAATAAWLPIPVLALSVPATALAGAALSIALEPASPMSFMTTIPSPELATAIYYIRTVTPPAVALAGWGPLLVYREVTGPDGRSATVQAGFWAVVLAAAAVACVAVLLNRRFEKGIA